MSSNKLNNYAGLGPYYMNYKSTPLSKLSLKISIKDLTKFS